MNLYNEVKELFNISDEAFRLYNTLRYTRKYNNSKDVLVIYENKKDLESDLRTLRENNYYVDFKRQYCKREDSNTTIYLKTLNQCKSLDGHRFKNIVFDNRT